MPLSVALRSSSCLAEAALALAKEAQFAVAKQFLAYTRLNLTQISVTLNFSVLSAFTHAFPHWSAKAPSAWWKEKRGGEWPGRQRKAALGLGEERRMRHPARILACTLALLATAARAQETRSLVAVETDSRMQMAAASLIPTLRGRWLHADHKLAVGRVQDVRVSPDGHTLIAVVARRRWLGGGEIGIPVPRLHQRDNDLTVSATRDDIRQLPVIRP